MTRDADVLVVGAGPAGAATARRLALEGVDVLLVDACAFPRSKPCGDCLSPGVTPLLREAGILDRLRARSPALLGEWRFRTPDGVWFGGRFGGGDGGAADSGGRAPSPGGEGSDEPTRAPLRGLALPRRELDRVLLEAALEAGARLRERLRVFGLVRREERVVGVRARDRRGEREVLAARVVVGADGLRSVVARRLGGVRRGSRDRLALVGRFRGVRPNGRSSETRAGEMRLSREGMLGLAPTGEDRWNATLVVPRSRAREVADDREGFFRARLSAYGVLHRFRGAELLGELETTGPFEVVPRRLTAPGALLVGDAAGYFDPLTGQGIHRALVTARAAARAAAGILAADGPAGAWAARRRYERALHRLLRPGRRVQRLVDEVVTRPWLVEPVGRLLAARPGLASLLVDVAGDRLPASALVDPRRLARAWSTGTDTNEGAG